MRCLSSRVSRLATSCATALRLSVFREHSAVPTIATRRATVWTQGPTQLIEAARSVLEALVEEVTGAKALSLHHDISTTTGEEVGIFALDGAPQFRATKRN
jgi:hypothetical protein